MKSLKSFDIRASSILKLSRLWHFYTNEIKKKKCHHLNLKLETKNVNKFKKQSSALKFVKTIAVGKKLQMKNGKIPYQMANSKFKRITHECFSWLEKSVIIFFFKNWFSLLLHIKVWLGGSIQKGGKVKVTEDKELTVSEELQFA